MMWHSIRAARAPMGGRYLPVSTSPSCVSTEASRGSESSSGRKEKAISPTIGSAAQRRLVRAASSQ
jgi:hypothetical protein